MAGSTMIILLSAVVLLLQTVDADQKDCPSENDIYPCYCMSDFTGYTFVSCEKLHDMNRIKEVLQATKGRNVSLGFVKSRLGDIPSDFFVGQISQDIHFDHCQIGSFGSKPFTGLDETLTKIYIGFSIDKKRKDLETFPLSHLKKLRDLGFQGNDIKRLGNEWFESGPESLEQLSLEANDIEELGDKAFQKLTNLKQIWLGDNRFKVIQRSMFPQPASKLEILEISFNGIETIPEDMFTGMPSLKVVNVDGNKLTTLPESTWGNIWNQLTEAYMDRNYNLECDKKIAWIYQRTFPEIFTGRCYGTNSLNGQQLVDLTADDFL